ncbi:hypothetical protein [Methylobacterium sp. WL6]|uniref:hypothetical protein n=1 Tax=Methylobacterium sp. WL6 TaxID=2603901 RepID=UPI0011CB6F2D|nr:hypothetical protein [Methylobacterium sp. WL6]TXN70485.1 hypothetical protein FV230_10560 [Methylobacterium sp. WL6]
MLHTSPHLTERDVTELWQAANVAPGDAIGPLTFVRHWMAWKAGRSGLPYHVLDTTKVVKAAALVAHAVAHGIVRVSTDLYVTRLSPGERMYERADGGGRRVLPPNRGRRTCEEVRTAHANLVGPTARDLLDRLSSQPGTIPASWSACGVVPSNDALTPLADAPVQLGGLTWTLDVQRQVLWLTLLRHEDALRGAPPPVALQEDDAAALATIGMPA